MKRSFLVYGALELPIRALESTLPDNWHLKSIERIPVGVHPRTEFVIEGEDVACFTLGATAFVAAAADFFSALGSGLVLAQKL